MLRNCAEQEAEDRAGSARTATPPTAAPRYLRFVRALVLGSAILAVPVAMSSCGNGQCDSNMPMPVDGPLPPPDLPLA